MDQIKIGRFIADRRKGMQLTQRQLADKLGVSDKTISKWECGKGLPEVALMMPLCELLNINVNELLSGEKLSDESYHKKAEENIMNLVKEKEESKKKIILSTIVGVMCVVSVTTMVMVAGVFEMETAARIALIVIACVVLVAGIGVACVLDRDAGTFECRHCNTRFVPDMGSYIKGAHTITTRYLKCPECGKSSYCKHRLSR